MASVVAAAILLALAPTGDGVELSWRAPPGCPSEPDVRASLAGLLGATQAREPVRASVEVERTATGDYAAELVVEIGERRSERTLTATQCVALADATALVIAVTVDPATALDDAIAADVAAPQAAIPEPLEAPDPAAAPVVEIAPAAVASRPATVESSPPRRRTRTRLAGVHVRAHGAADYGALPGVTGSIGAAVGVHGPWFRVELSGAWTFAREGRARSVPSARGRVALWAIAARGCGVPRWGRLELPLCAGVEAGALEGDGVGATVRPQHARRPWIAVTAGPALAFAPIPGVALLAGADLVVPVWRARFLVGEELVHRPIAIGVRAGVGVELRFEVRP